jgi:hypothetical protein
MILLIFNRVLMVFIFILFLSVVRSCAMVLLNP